MRNRFVQVGLSLTFLGLLIQVVLIAPSQIRDNESKAALLPVADFTAQDLDPTNNVDQRINGMHMIETQDGRREWELWSEKAISLKAKEMLQLAKVKAIFFSDSGVTFTVTGETGHVHTKSKNLRVEGSVVTHSSNGYVFRTEAIDYDSKTRLLTSTTRVEMWGPKDSEGHAMHLTGMGMKASIIESNMEILDNVHAEKGLDRGRKAYIKSQRSIFSGKDKTARFLDRVILDLDSMRITGPEARFDYDKKTDAVKSVLVSGGARVSDSDKWATAQNVSVDFETNKFVFRGDPRVVQNNDELRGEEIVFLDGGKQVQVQRARALVDEKRLEKKK